MVAEMLSSPLNHVYVTGEVGFVYGQWSGRGNGDYWQSYVWGQAGNDKFQIAPDLTATSIPIFVDGGDPIGTTAGDTILIFAPNAPVLPEPGPENDEGGFVIGGADRVSYDHIEAIAVTANCALILGTNADDIVTSEQGQRVWIRAIAAGAVVQASDGRAEVLTGAPSASARPCA